MICNVYLSKVLKLDHKITSTLTITGLVTTITFDHINIKAAIISINPGRNNIQLSINDSEWELLSNHINDWNKV